MPYALAFRPVVGSRAVADVEDGGTTDPFEFERLFDASPVPSCVATIEGRVVRVNAAFSHCVGSADDGRAGSLLATLINARDEVTGGILEDVASGASHRLESRVRGDDGTVRRVAWTIVREPCAGRLLATGHVLSERPGDLLAVLAQQVPGVIYQFQLWPDGRSCFPFASDAIRDIYEVTPDEVHEDATPVFERIHADDAAAVVESISRSAQSLEPWRHEYRVVLPVQGERWRSGQARPERQADGSVLWHGFITDITDRKRVEEELLRKDAAIASSINGIAMAGLDGAVTYVNRAFLDLWGYEGASDVLGRSVVSFWAAPELASDVAASVQRQGHWSGELVARRTDGTSRTLQVNASAFNDTSGRMAGMLASFVDVTESKRLQEQFLQAQKMESIGRLAGGVAHDFNNLLTVIKGYLQLAVMGLDDGHPLRDGLAEAERAADSAAALTQQLLAFSRKQVITPEVVNLNDIVGRMQAMLRRLLGEDIELKTLMAADLGTVRFDHSQSEQILINLAVNARDAMPAGGTLTIETANVQFDEAAAGRHAGMAGGDYVMLCVSDTGAGMSDEVKVHLFEPFFTTKGPGRGTGLGLAMIYGAVSQNGGRIEVYSELGLGTAFKVYLPRLAEEARSPIATSRASLPVGHETIVLVEDDERVRKLAERLLERQGYRVHAFSNGPDAIEEVRTMTEPLHLLMTDIIMPVMNGRRLAEQIQALRPEIRVLFTSGYTANVILRHGVDESVEFLAKPYSIGTLAERVRDVLDRPAGAP